MSFQKEQMQRFQTAINTADEALMCELVADDAPFYTPMSPEPMVGGKGYLAIVHLFLQSFPDVQWQAEAMVEEGNIVVVQWLCTGTHLGDFMGKAPTGNKFATRIMNFYYFNKQGKIINDVAAEGLIKIVEAVGLLGR
ncbi:ester cyclase [Actinobacillus genomosp. 2]|uniref:ester cyclase n=1 Tax=Actinobacillus genomosp. 2 TaxID=230709 RepID=UPI0024429B90|nr:ester cyclase [Actinobacillus genomosp. 2]WGE32192.1 ester cyclase [Actinobacillus genomosp. 2]